MTIPRGYLLVQQWFCHYRLLNIEQISWYLTGFLNFVNKYTWVPQQIRKKQGYQIPGSSARSLSLRPSCSANNHDISGKLKHVACFTCLLLFCGYSCFVVNSMTEKFNSVPPKLLSPLSFYYNQEPFMRKSYLRAGENVHALLIHS